MESIKLPCTLEGRISKEGNPYMCISIKVTDTYEKLVFLEKSEIELIKMVFGNEKTTNSISVSKPTVNKPTE